MKYLKSRNDDRGAVLIVVIGILAVLSLIAATFGMVMAVELASSQNQSEHELARQAALAGYEYLIRSLRDYGAAGLASGTIPEFCPDPTDPFGAYRLPGPSDLKVYWLASSAETSPERQADLVNKEWADGLGLEKTGMFNINAMGHAGDAGNQTYNGIHYSSFSASLARLLKSRFDNLPTGGADDIDAYYTTWDDTIRWRVARYLASAIISYRYGKDGVPGTRSIEEHALGNRPNYLYWSGVWDASDDTGVAPPGDFWGTVSVGSTDAIAQTVLEYDAVGAATASTLTSATASPWIADAHIGHIITAIDSAGTTFQSRLISDNNTDTVAIFDAWTTIPDATYTYVIQTREDFWRTVTGVGVWNSANLWLNPDPAQEGMSGFDPTTTRKDDGWIGILASNESGALTFLAGTWTAPDIPMPGDTFAICASGTPLVGAGDGIPTALTWPNGALACEKYVFPLARDTGDISAVAGLDITIDHTPPATFNPVGMVIRLDSGSLRGQVREITAWDSATNTLTIDSAWTGTLTAGTDYAIEYAYFHEGQPSAVGTDTLTAEVGANWQPNDCWAGCIVSIVSDPVTPDAVGQARLIESNTSNTLTLTRNWRDLPSTSAEYRIELPRDDKYRPDQLQGDDRIYHSVAEILPIIIDALYDDKDQVFDTTSAGEVAAILYSSFKDYLSVSNRAITRKDENAGINDWLTDGIDNDDNGVIDDENPSTAQLALALYNNLGLRDWAHSTSGDVSQAAQVVANIIDFRDSDHIPTVLTDTDLSETTLFTVRGYEGIHVTEVMATPDLVDPADTTYIPEDFIVPRSTLDSEVGTELIEDFLGRSSTANYDAELPIPPYYSQLKDTSAPDPLGTRLPLQPGWDWTWDGIINYGWWVAHEAPCEGKWEYDVAAGHEILDGWYAMRLKLNPGASFLITNSAAEIGYADDSVDADGYAYVRQGTTFGANTRLLAFEVTGGKIQFNINTTTLDDVFYSFQLLPQYVEITNTAAEDISLSTVNCGNGAVTLPAGTKIRGASADGNYPIKYGTFVVGMSEAAYERQWTLNQGLSGTNNGNGIWGDGPDEDYPAYFAGDVSDAEAAKLMIPHDSPTIVVQNGANTLAQTGSGTIDGEVGACLAYSSKEKSIAPFSTTWADFDGAPTELSGSQNELLTGAASERSNLNKNYTALWTIYPSLNTGATLEGNDQVFPIILNRPYPTAGWLGLVPTGNDPWRTIDADATPADDPSSAEELLGTIMARALVGGVHARINLNNPSVPMRLHTLEASVGTTAARALAHEVEAGTATGLSANYDELLGSGWTAGEHVGRTVYIRNGTGVDQSRKIIGNDTTTLYLDRDWITRPDATSEYSIFEETAWTNWDELLNDSAIIATCAQASQEDSGAGLIADDFPDDSDENEEWARRYSNLLDLRTSNLKYVIAGFVYQGTADVGDPPLAQVRIEADFNISGDDVNVVQFRYVMD